jgi:hypothetical protein
VEQHDDVGRGVVSGKALGGELRLDGRHDALVDELFLVGADLGCIVLNDLNGADLSKS